MYEIEHHKDNERVSVIGTCILMYERIRGVNIRKRANLTFQICEFKRSYMKGKMSRNIRCFYGIRIHIAVKGTRPKLYMCGRIDIMHIHEK